MSRPRSAVLALALAAALVQPPLHAADTARTERSREAQALLDRYYQAAYPEVGAAGPTLLEREPHDAELRLAVANSLAWSGSGPQALEQYQALLGTRYHADALLGIGNVNRWNGHPVRAARAYRELLHLKPEHQEARAGLDLAEDKLRPVTRATVARASNSDDAYRTVTTLAHAWRNADGERLYEVSAIRVDEDNPQARIVQRELSLRYENADAFLHQAELSVQQSPTTMLFGAIKLKLSEQLALGAGRINWGRLAFNPVALRDGLTANTIGAEFRSDSRAGDFVLHYDAFRVSDGNLIHAASLRLTPALQPFDSTHVRWFTGLELRKARFNDARYWSPEDGHYVALAGLAADWSDAQWEVYGSAQIGFPLGGESGRSWSAGFGLRRWLGRDWALSGDVWAINHPRDGGYKSQSVSLRIEKRW